MSAKRLLFVVLVFVLALSACAPRQAPAAGETGGLEQFVEDLEAGGAEVELGDELDDQLFPVPGRVVRVNGLDLTVFEFADAAAREAAQATIQGGGFIIGEAMVDWIDTPHFWGKDRLLVLYVGKDQGMVDRLSALLGEQVVANPPAGGMQPGDDERLMAPFILAAIDALAQELGIPKEEIHYVSEQPFEFSDSCLGLGGPAESCLQALTPGHIVTLEAQGQEYVVHTDEEGSAARVKPGAEAGEGEEAAPYVAAAVEALRQQLDIAAEEIRVVAEEQVEFSDSCLGLGGPAESCLQVITPGYVVSLEAQGAVYEVHVDEVGSMVRVKP
jgi:hypothetical protein